MKNLSRSENIFESENESAIVIKNGNFYWNNDRDTEKEQLGKEVNQK